VSGRLIVGQGGWKRRAGVEPLCIGFQATAWRFNGEGQGLQDRDGNEM